MTKHTHPQTKQNHFQIQNHASFHKSLQTKQQKTDHGIIVSTYRYVLGATVCPACSEFLMKL